MRFLKKIKVPAAYIMVLVFLSARVLSLHAETIADTEEPLPAVEKEVSSDIDTYLTEETFAEDFDLTQPAEADDLDLTQPAEADDFTEEGVSSLPEEGTPDDQVQPSPGAEEAPADQDRSESEAVPQEAELPVESPEESVEPVFIEEENQESADQYTGLQESADQYAETQVSVTETPGDLEEALILEEEAEEEIVIPVENGDINTDNDDLFASYVDRELELGEDLKTGTADTAPRQMLKAPLLRSRLASSRLNSYNQALYQVLLEGIRQVAAGTLTHTVFEVTPEEAGFADLRWSAEDLGVDDVVTRNGDGKATAINPDASAALKGILSFSFNAVNKALLADCPFDLYWFDKTGMLHYDEYFPDQTRRMYQGHSGWVYQLEANNLKQLDKMSWVYLSETDIPVCRAHYIPDLYKALLDAEQAGHILLHHGIFSGRASTYSLMSRAWRSVRQSACGLLWT